MPQRSPFPPYNLNDALAIARAIWEKNSGQPMRKITLFNILGRQPDSGSSRSLITASGGYGLTQGSYAAEMLTLMPRGRSIAEDDDAKAKLDAVLQPEIFRAFFERYRDSLVPSKPAALDFLRSQGIQDSAVESCYSVVIANGKQVGLIREMSGKERIITYEHALELANYQPSTRKQPEAVDKEDQEDEEDIAAPPDVPSQKPPKSGVLPSVHVDIQIHIPSDAGAEQIDHIFASMAKHLYGRG